MAYSENNSQKQNTRFRYEVMEHIGVLNWKNNGWTREVNIVAWNNNPPKVDIREWDPNHKRMSRGVTLLEEEAEKLAMLLAKRYGITYPGYVQARPKSESRQQESGYREERFIGTQNYTGSAPYERIPQDRPFDEDRSFKEDEGIEEDSTFGEEDSAEAAGASAAMTAEGAAGQDSGYEPALAAAAAVAEESEAAAAPAEYQN